MEDEKTRRWLILATAVFALLAGISYVFDLRRDEPPPDVSDLLLDYVETPTPGTFGAFLAEEKLTIEKTIREKIDDENNAAYDKCHEQGGRRDRFFDYWNAADMDRALAEIPEEFWRNLEAALIAPRERVIGTYHDALTTITTARMLEIKAQRLAKKGEIEQALQLATKIVVLGKAYSQTHLSDHLRTWSPRHSEYRLSGNGKHPVGQARCG